MSYEGIEKCVDFFRGIQIKFDSDVIVAVTGMRGSGKSTFDIQITRKYLERHLKENFTISDLNKYVGYNNDDVFKKIYSLPKFNPLIGDEAIRFIWSRDWNRSPNKELIRLTTQIRTKKLLFFLNIPKITWMDSSFREAMVDIWVWTWATLNKEGEKESYAFVFQRDENQGEGDSWHLAKLRDMQRRKKKSIIGKFSDVDNILKMIKKHPCFFDAFKFPKLPQEMYDAYQKIRDERAFEKESEYVNQKDIGKIMSYNLKYKWQSFMERIKKQGTPSTRAIQEILLNDPSINQPLVSHNAISQWINDIKNKLPQEKQPIEVKEEFEEDAHNPII